MLYNIAGIITDMYLRYPTTIKQSEAYIYKGDRKPQITIDLSDEYLKDRQKENPHLSLDSCEYIWYGSIFYNAILSFEGFLLHSSAVVHNGKAYLFSAPCGTGKSTHTQLWLKCFDDAYILNDDKPAIIHTDKGWMVSGTPFSGKTDLNVNKVVPLGGICALERGKVNRTGRIESDEALYRILNQTIRPSDQEKMDKLLSLLDSLISEKYVYKLECNMEEDAAKVSYAAMSGEEKVNED